MTLDAATVPVLEGLSALASRYDAWLCDIWGVLHNGVRPFEAAAEACIRFRDGGGSVILVSNSPRPAPRVIAQLDDIGVPRQAYDSAATSGDVTRALVRDRPGERVFHLGPDRDKPVFEGLDVAFAPPDEAEFVVCSGLYDDTRDTPDDYAGLLSDLAARDLTMICANPDLKVERGTDLVYCAGALAAAYEALGGTVIYAGKPYAPLYELALRRLAEHRGAQTDRARILAVGDGIKTDLAGAAAMGLDSVYVASGLHVEGAGDGAPLAPNRVAALFAGQPFRPVAAVPALAW